jgi:acetyl esterase/lipase
MRLLIQLLMTSLVMVAPATAPDPPVPDFSMNIWPGKPPGPQLPATMESWIKSDLTNISIPTIDVYRPDKSKDTGTAILICPGGGFKKLVVGKEGHSAAKWLSSIGVTAIVLNYRVPYPEGTPKYLLGVQDGQRAICLIRAKAAQWNIDPHRIGLIGFSAGGKMGVNISTNFDKLAYEPVDEIDKQSARPDFVLAIYPGDLTPNDGRSNVTPDVRPTKQTPPTFIAIATDDKNGSENAVYYYLALKRAGANAELHVYSEGQHGFAFRAQGAGDPHSKWTVQAVDWMNYHGFLRAGAATQPDTATTQIDPAN